MATTKTCSTSLPPMYSSWRECGALRDVSVPGRVTAKHAKTDAWRASYVGSFLYYSGIDMRRIPQIIQAHGGPGQVSTARATRNNLAVCDRALRDIYAALSAATSHEDRLATLQWIEFKAQLAALILRGEGHTEEAAGRIFASVVVALDAAKLLSDAGSIAVAVDLQAKAFRGLDLPGFRAADPGDAPMLLARPSTVVTMAKALRGPLEGLLELESRPHSFGQDEHQRFLDDGTPAVTL